MAYSILRERVDALVNEAYPQFSGPDTEVPGKPGLRWDDDESLVGDPVGQEVSEVAEPGVPERGNVE